MNKVLLLAIVLVGVSCGDQGSAGPEAGYTLADIVARPAELDGREVAVSASVSDVARPYAFRLATGDGTSGTGPGWRRQSGRGEFCPGHGSRGGVSRPGAGTG